MWQLDQGEIMVIFSIGMVETYQKILLWFLVLQTLFHIFLIENPQFHRHWLDAVLTWYMHHLIVKGILFGVVVWHSLLGPDNNM